MSPSWQCDSELQYNNPYSSRWGFILKNFIVYVNAHFIDIDINSFDFLINDCIK